MMINLESALHIDRFVQDTFHQGSDVFSDISRGRQCVANAFVSCVAAHISEKPASDWTSSNIDNVLLGGDALYCYTRKSVNSVYLEPCELPTYICMEGQRVKCYVKETYSGDRGVSFKRSGDFFCLESALLHCLGDI